MGLSLSQFGLEMAVGDSKLVSEPSRDCISKLRSFDIYFAFAFVLILLSTGLV